MWLPPGTQQAVASSKKALINILGRSGVGKSHLVYQLARDRDYGPESVLVLMSEDSTATYDAPVNIKRVTALGDVEQTVVALIDAGKRGRVLPRIVVWDSLSGTMDYQQRFYAENPMLSKAGQRDKLAEYGDLGQRFTELMIFLRDQIPTDIVVLTTTTEGPLNTLPEICVPGKITPRHLTRLSTCTLYMRSEEKKYDPVQGVPPESPHRTIGYDETGAPLGVLVNRYFITQDTGEVMAKGHRTLGLRERAILPDVLRKIHGSNMQDNMPQQGKEGE